MQTSHSPSPAPEAVDLLVVGAAELATPLGVEPLAGAVQGEIQVIEGGAVAIRGERIVAVGPEAELRARYRAGRELDAAGGTLVPGFVDGHSHPVFAGTREAEFELRTRGASYVEIARAGGGIASSLKGVREASSEELLAALELRIARFLELGTTTLEAKSGYGLDLANELKMLEVIRAADGLSPLTLVPTFLGAHDYPPEFREDHEGYERLLIEEMLPAVAERGLARSFDIFTEAHVFDIETSRRILTRAVELGFELRMHVDQLTPLGGAELAAELGATTADHLEHVSPAGIEALARAGVIPMLSPLVPLYLRVEEREAPARAMLDAGLPVALSTDFNPGSCYCQSMPEVLTWSALRYRMTAAECLTGATLNGACSLGLGADRGSLEPGKRADLLILDLPSHTHLCYELGRNPVRATLVAGEPVPRRD